MRAATTEGTVIRFDEIKGYGFVSPDDGGEDVFLHVNDLTFDKRMLTASVRVGFAPEDGERGLKASRVRLLAEQVAVPSSSTAEPPPSRPRFSIEEQSTAVSAEHLRHELTEGLLTACPSLRGDQVLEVRDLLLRVARAHDWIT